MQRPLLPELSGTGFSNELPPRVEVFDGAMEAYEFDWALAQELLDELAYLASETSALLMSRSTLTNRIEDWAGPYRNGHDTSLGNRIDESGDLVVELRSLAEAIVEAAHAVNEEQAWHNYKAVEAAYEQAREDGRDDLADTLADVLNGGDNGDGVWI